MIGRAKMGQVPGDQGTVGLAEAAERLGISLGTLQTIVEHGFLKGYQDTDGQWHVRLEPGEGIPPRSQVRAAAPANPLPPTQPPAARPVSDPPVMAARWPARDDSLDGAPAMAATPEPEVGRSTVAPIRDPGPAMPEPAMPETAIPEPAMPQPAGADSAPAAAAPPATPAPSPVTTGNDGALAAFAQTMAATATVERVLNDQIAYLRGQIERRDAEIARKDQFIGDIAGRLAKLGRRNAEQAPGESELQREIQRLRSEQAEITARHQRAIDSLGDLLLSLRNHLAGQHRPGERSVG